MKSYKRAKERRKHLHSVTKYTSLESDEQCREAPGISASEYFERGTSGCDCKIYGSGWDKPRRSGTKDRRAKIQHQQSDAPKVCCKSRFPHEDGREHWPQCGNEGEAVKVVRLEIDNPNSWSEIQSVLKVK